jgi:hypothetical protein
LGRNSLRVKKNVEKSAKKVAPKEHHYPKTYFKNHHIFVDHSIYGNRFASFFNGFEIRENFEFFKTTNEVLKNVGF